MHIVSLDDETPADLRKSWHELRATTDLELEPHIPPSGFDEALADATSDAMFDRLGWLLMNDSTAVGYAQVEMPKLDNPQLAYLHLGIDPHYRRAGHATALLKLAALAARDHARRSIVVEAVDGSAGEKACATLGAAPALGSTASTLHVADVDPAQIQAWIAGHGERGGDYSLVRWVDRCPPNLVAQYADLRNAMNTAPMGDLDMLMDWSPESVRASEQAAARSGRRSYALCARHDVTGELAGLTVVLVPKGRPTLGIQEDTVVRPDHRERGLGRWLKAEMLQWLASTEPQLEQIVTWNATENAAMRGINTELGFAARDTWTEYQFTTDALLAELDRRATNSR